jgi:hypothetical protein
VLRTKKVVTGERAPPKPVAKAACILNEASRGAKLRRGYLCALRVESAFRLRETLRRTAVALAEAFRPTLIVIFKPFEV